MIETVDPSGPTGNFDDDAPDPLSSLEIAFAEAVALGASLREASTTTGVPYRTCRRWRHRPEIQSLIRDLARESVQAGTLALGQGSATAARTLKAIAEGSQPAEGPRVTACRAILEIGLRVLEVEQLHERMEILEERIAELPGRFR